MNNRRKIVGSICLFALLWGVLVKGIGLFSAFDSIETVGEVPPPVVFGVLSMIFCGVALGLIILLIARLGTILLACREKW